MGVSVGEENRKIQILERTLNALPAKCHKKKSKQTLQSICENLSRRSLFFHRVKGLKKLRYVASLRGMGVTKMTKITTTLRESNIGLIF